MAQNFDTTALDEGVFRKAQQDFCEERIVAPGELERRQGSEAWL